MTILPQAKLQNKLVKINASENWRKRVMNNKERILQRNKCIKYRRCGE